MQTMTQPYSLMWVDFGADQEARFRSDLFPTSCSAEEVHFHMVLLIATEKHIPSGYLRNDLTNLFIERTLPVKGCVVDV